MNEHLERIKQAQVQLETLESISDKVNELLKDTDAYKTVEAAGEAKREAQAVVNSAIHDYKAIAEANPSVNHDFIKEVNRSSIEIDLEEGLDWAIEQKNTDVLKLDVKEYKKLEPAAKTLGLNIKKVLTKQYQFMQKAFTEALKEESKDEPPF